MSTYKSIADVIKENEYWLRLIIFVNEPLKQSLLHVLHNKSNNPDYVGLPEDPTKLYQELLNKHDVIDSLKIKQRKVLRQEQVDLLLPTSCKTDSSRFDVTLLVILIRHFTTLIVPVKGWNKDPPHDDNSIAANAIRAREWRNYVQHVDPKVVDERTFQQEWTYATQIINDLGYNYDTNALQTISLDPKLDFVNNSILECVDKGKQEMITFRSNIVKMISEHETCFESVEAHSQDLVDINKEIVDVKDNVLKLTKSVSVLSFQTVDVDNNVTILNDKVAGIEENVFRNTEELAINKRAVTDAVSKIEANFSEYKQTVENKINNLRNDLALRKENEKSKNFFQQKGEYKVGGFTSYVKHLDEGFSVPNEDMQVPLTCDQNVSNLNSNIDNLDSDFNDVEITNLAKNLVTLEDQIENLLSKTKNFDCMVNQLKCIEEQNLLLKRIQTQNRNNNASKGI